jgi:hypothetical protein
VLPHHDKWKTRLTTVPSQDFKRWQLLAELEALKASANRSSASSIQDFTDTSYADTSLPASIDDSFLIDITMEPQPTIKPDQPILKHKRSIHPDPEPVWLNKNWKSLIPTLVSLISYQNSTLGCVVPSATNILAGCDNLACSTKSSMIMCLYANCTLHFLSFMSLSSSPRLPQYYPECLCLFPVASVLIEHGLFPASPSQPHVAISINLLEIYRALFERSCNAIHALLGALCSFYVKHRFQLVNEKVSSTLPNSHMHHLTFVSQGQFIQDGFHWSLASATQWYDTLRSCIEQHLEDAVEVASYQLPLRTLPGPPRALGLHPEPLLASLGFPKPHLIPCPPPKVP